jgi:Protein of unknown function (DUF1367)
MKPDLECRVFYRRSNTLVPADIHAEEMFNTIKDGKEVLLRVFKPRNVQHHRKLFAILNCVVENSEKYNDIEELLVIVKLAVGYATVVQGMDGEMYRVPRSISFSSMPQDEFERFFPRAVYVLSRLSDIPEDVLLNEANNA